MSDSSSSSDSSSDASSDEDDVVVTTCEKCGKQRYLVGKTVEHYEEHIRRLQKNIPLYHLGLSCAGLPGCCCLLQKIIDLLEIRVGIKQNGDGTNGISRESIQSLQSIIIHCNNIQQQSLVRQLLRPLLFFQNVVYLEIHFDEEDIDAVGMLLSSHESLKQVELWYTPILDDPQQEGSAQNAVDSLRRIKERAMMPKLGRQLSQLPNLTELAASTTVLIDGFETPTKQETVFFPKLKSLSILRDDHQPDKTAVSEIVDVVEQQQKLNRSFCRGGVTKLNLLVNSHAELEEVCNQIIANKNNKSTSIEELNIRSAITPRPKLTILIPLIDALKYNNKRLKKLTFKPLSSRSQFRMKRHHVDIVDMLVDTLIQYNYTIGHLDIFGNCILNLEQQSDIDFHLELNRIGRGKLMSPSLSLPEATASRPCELATRDEWVDAVIKSSTISYSSLFYLIRSKPELCTLQGNQDSSPSNELGSVSNRPKRRDFADVAAATEETITKKTKRLCTSDHLH